MAPGKRGFRKAVQTQRQAISRTSHHDIEVDAIGADGAMGEGRHPTIVEQVRMAQFVRSCSPKAVRPLECLHAGFIAPAAQTGAIIIASADVIDSPHRPPSVFLSYASEDRPAARSIRDVLAAFGIEVWYDENELDGGDAWDQKIRRQIRECDYFMPIVSATTEARSEGYFRREWRLAVERTLDMADDHTFLLPVAIDGTTEAGARVPERFVAVQWLKAPGGQSTPALEALCRRIASGNKTVARAASSAPDLSNRPRGKRAAPLSFPDFPREEPGQRIRFWFQAAGWPFRCAWIAFTRLPRLIRIVAYSWLFIAVLSRGWHSPHPHSADLSPTKLKKLEAIANAYPGSSNPADIARLRQQVASEFSDDAEEETQDAPLLAIPFRAPAGDPAAAKLVNSTFAQLYGRIAISHQGKVALSREPPLAGLDPGAALLRGKASHSTYVLWGAIDSQALTVEIATVSDGSVLWSKSYPVSGADPLTIAAEAESKLAFLDK
jgi:hypothetical protein